MYKKALMAIVAIAMISMMLAPAFAWEYPDGSHDTKYETFGPRADSMLIKLYASEVSEWETGLEGGEIDITDWPLDHTHLVKYTTAPWSSSLNVYGYGAEFGAYLFDLNNNNNTYLGNPPDSHYPNPMYPNPMGYTVAESGIMHDNGWYLRAAIAHLVNRNNIVSYVGTEAAVAIYTPTPPCYGKYCDNDIQPGGAREDLTYPYDPAAATALLNAAGWFPIGGDGWRYWDRNRNGVKDAGEDLTLKLIARIDHAPRDYMGTQLGIELTNQHIHVNVQHITITAARLQWMTNKAAHIYTAGWSLGTTPDSCILWNWDYYWHPGNSYNTGACNKDAFNTASYGVMYANTQDDAVVNCHTVDEVFCDAVLGIAVYCASGYKAMSKTYVGNEVDEFGNPLHGEDWYGTVNWLGYGIDNSWTFMNMHTSCHDYGGEIRYGFKTTDMRQLNPIYTEWIWDNTVLGLVGYDSLVAQDPYTLQYLPWVCLNYSVGTYTHPTYGTCTKVVFTLRNDVYFQDGVQLSMADIAFSFIEIDDLLKARGLAPPWWISNVQDILSFSILDPLNFEVLLDVKSIFAVGWIGGNRILPKHIWKPIVTGAIAPKSGHAWDPTTFAPDPDLIAQGPFRLDEYVASSYILLQANKPGSVVDTGISDPNENSHPVNSTMGYFQYNPVDFEPYTDTLQAKVNPGFPNTSTDVAVTVSDHNRRRQSWTWTATIPNLNNPIGGTLAYGAYTYTIVAYMDDNPPPGLSVSDMITITETAPVDPMGRTFVMHIEDMTALGGNQYRITTGQVIEVDKTVSLDGVPVTTQHEYLKPCIPITEHFVFPLSKCKHTISVSKHTVTQWLMSCPNGIFTRNPEYCKTRTVTWVVWITIPEDITGSYYVDTQLLAPDCKVDLKDVFLAGKAFGSVPGNAKWNAVADINHDYKIDLKDYFAICKKFGKW